MKEVKEEVTIEEPDLTKMPGQDSLRMLDIVSVLDLSSWVLGYYVKNAQTLSWNSSG